MSILVSENDAGEQVAFNPRDVLWARENKHHLRPDGTTGIALHVHLAREGVHAELVLPGTTMDEFTKVAELLVPR